MAPALVGNAPVTQSSPDFSSISGAARPAAEQLRGAAQTFLDDHRADEQDMSADRIAQALAQIRALKEQHTQAALVDFIGRDRDRFVAREGVKIIRAEKDSYLQARLAA
jgi:hypothetical protein